MAMQCVVFKVADKRSWSLLSRRKRASQRKTLVQTPNLGTLRKMTDDARRRRFKWENPA